MRMIDISYDARIEFENLVRIVLKADKIERWAFPPSIIFVKAALMFNTSFLDGAFGTKKSIIQLGIGKSVYGLKTLYHAYMKNWNRAKKYIVFMPQHFLSLFEEAIDKNVRIPAILWDDAAFWIGRMRWQSELVKTVKEFLGVVRTHCAYIIFTAPKWTDLARPIREDLNFSAIIRRVFTYNNDPNASRSKAEYYTFEDLEKIYHRDKNVAPFTVYYFKLYFDHYPEYETMRKEYVKIGKERMKERLKEIAREAKEEMQEIMKKYDQKRKPDNLVEPDEIEYDEEEIEELEEEYDVKL
jgi:hypothetical protein